MQKTILLPIYNGIRSRNFFRTDVYKNLISDKNIRLVVIVPSYKLDFYKNEFKTENLIFDVWDDLSEPWFGGFLNAIAFDLLGTGTIGYKQELIYIKDHNFLKFCARRLVSKLFARFIWPKKVIRVLDSFVGLNKNVLSILDRYKPDIVVVPDIVFTPDRVFLRAAKRKRILTVGLIRSWDNLTSKGVIQILPDKLIVQTTKMKDEAIKYAQMPAKNIYISGVPQFDDYFRPGKLSKENFLKKLNIPAGGRLILCAPFYDAYSNNSASKIVNELIGAICDKKLPSDIYLLVRNRPESMGSSEVEKNLVKDSHIIITNPCSYSFNAPDGRRDHEFSQSDVDLLADSLRFSDVTINTISTLTIDAAAFDKPVINIRFDNEENCPLEHSVKILSRYDHYKEVEATGGVKLANSMEELILLIDKYLKNPELDKEGRMEIRKLQIEFMDGNSGKRVAEYIKEFIYFKK